MSCVILEFDVALIVAIEAHCETLTAEHVVRTANEQAQIKSFR